MRENGLGHRRTWEYDTVYGVLPIKEQLHLNQHSLLQDIDVDPEFGVTLSSRGFYIGGTSLQKTLYDYDALGRVIAITKPGDTRSFPTEAYGYRSQVSFVRNQRAGKIGH